MNGQKQLRGVALDSPLVNVRKAVKRVHPETSKRVGTKC